MSPETPNDRGKILITIKEGLDITIGEEIRIFVKRRNKPGRSRDYMLQIHAPKVLKITRSNYIPKEQDQHD